MQLLDAVCSRWRSCRVPLQRLSRSVDGSLTARSVVSAARMVFPSFRAGTRMESRGHFFLWRMASDFAQGKTCNADAWIAVRSQTPKITSCAKTMAAVVIKLQDRSLPKFVQLFLKFLAFCRRRNGLAAVPCIRGRLGDKTARVESSPIFDVERDSS